MTPERMKEVMAFASGLLSHNFTPAVEKDDAAVPPIKGQNSKSTFFLEGLLTEVTAESKKLMVPKAVSKADFMDAFNSCVTITDEDCEIETPSHKDRANSIAAIAGPKLIGQLNKSIPGFTAWANTARPEVQDKEEIFLVVRTIAAAALDVIQERETSSVADPFLTVKRQACKAIHSDILLKLVPVEADEEKGITEDLNPAATLVCLSLDKQIAELTALKGKAQEVPLEDYLSFAKEKMAANSANEDGYINLKRASEKK